MVVCVSVGALGQTDNLSRLYPISCHMVAGVGWLQPPCNPDKDGPWIKNKNKITKVYFFECMLQFFFCKIVSLQDIA